MSDFYAGDGPAAQQRWSIIDALRRYGTDASRVGHLFATQHGLQESDLEALVAIMSAEGHGDPLTPGQLRRHLGLSSAGTSYVIDRLVKKGHIERRRDHPSDHRIVHLHYTQLGQRTALAFFGPLGVRTEQVLDGFTPEELECIRRFIEAAADAMATHLREMEPEPLES